MAALMTPRFVVTDEEIRHVNEGTCDQIPREQQERILVMLPATLRFRVDLRPFLTLVRGDLFVKLTASRGDDLCYIILLPAHNLWKYQVCNLLGEVAEMISKRFGIYAHFSDPEFGTWDGQPIPRKYTMLEVTFSSLSSSQWVQEANLGFHICGLTLGYGPEVEPLSLHEEVHMAI